MISGGKIVLESEASRDYQAFISTKVQAERINLQMNSHVKFMHLYFIFNKKFPLKEKTVFRSM